MKKESHGNSVIKNANDVKVESSIQELFHGFLDARLNPKLLKYMNLPSLNMREVAAFYGYTFEASEAMGNRDFTSLSLLSFKFLFDFLYGDIDIAELPRYTRPILL